MEITLGFVKYIIAFFFVLGFFLPVIWPCGWGGHFQERPQARVSTLGDFIFIKPPAIFPHFRVGLRHCAHRSPLFAMPTES